MDKTISCEGCTDRHVGCHATCEAYAIRRAAAEERYRARVAKKKASEDIYAAASVIRRKANKRAKEKMIKAKKL